MKRTLSTYFEKENYKQTLLVVVFLLYLVQKSREFIDAIFEVVQDYSGWNGLTDYYINYQGGFVRRGLIGEILFFIANHSDINVEWIIRAICVTCFVFLCYFFIKSFRRKGYLLYILPLCFFFGFPHFRNKDYLMICVLILNLWAYRSSLSTIAKFFIINVSAIFVVLSHEAYVMIAFPVLFLTSFAHYKAYYKEQKILKSFISTLLFLLPSILTMFIVANTHGDSETAQIIWDSWMKLFNEEPSMVDSHSAIGALGFDIKYQTKFAFGLNFLTVSYGVPSSIGWIVTLLAVYYLIINYLGFFCKDAQNYTSDHRTALSSILVLQFICLLPMFFAFSSDYGRLFFYWTASSFAIFLLIPLDNVLKLFPAFFIQCVNRFNRGISAVAPPSKIILIILILITGLSPVQFSMGAILKTSVLYNVYELFKDIILMF